jgi:beta-lactamase class A
MLFDDRWVYFCVTINRYAKAAIDVETVNAFTAAGSRALTMVKEGLSA